MTIYPYCWFPSRWTTYFGFARFTTKIIFEGKSYFGQHGGSVERRTEFLVGHTVQFILGYNTRRATISVRVYRENASAPLIDRSKKKKKKNNSFKFLFLFLFRFFFFLRTILSVFFVRIVLLSRTLFVCFPLVYYFFSLLTVSTDYHFAGI